MSSQGAASGSNNVSSGSNGCFGPTVSSQIPVGIRFSAVSIKDGSDWTSFIKKQRILNENKTRGFQDPWFARGNNYRLDYLGGLYQNGTPPTCAGCDPTAYSANGPF
jgi:hypothetical protein